MPGLSSFPIVNPYLANVDPASYIPGPGFSSVELTKLFPLALEPIVAFLLPDFTT